MSFVLACEFDVEGLAQQHPGNAAQADQDKDLLYIGLGLEHELIASRGGRSVLEQHHVDEHDQHGRSAARGLGLDASLGIVAEPLEEPK